MSVASYGVLRGRATAKRDASKGSPHFEIKVNAARRDHRIVLNVRSKKPHEVLYLVDHDYQHPATRRLLDEAKDGFTALAPQPGGLAIDYVRSDLFDTARLRPVPADLKDDSDLEAVIDAVIERAIADEDARVFAFGHLVPADKKSSKDPTFGFSPAASMHGLHMNQGNSRERASEDGTWRDGGLLVYFPSAQRWVATFIAFRSQTFQTDPAGHAVGSGRSHTAPRNPEQPMAPLGITQVPMEITEEGAAPDTDNAPGETHVSTALPKALTRTLRAYSFDPSRGRVLDNEMLITVRNRKLGPGPVELGDQPDRIAVVDYDGHTKQYYKPVDLDHKDILLQNGLWPSESDPRFHQQMVYAVARETIEHFEAALGRQIHWRRAERDNDGHNHGWLDGDIGSLGLFPHAMRAPNAYYSPDAHGILFGYFAADRTNTQRSLPGQPVFTCLSHDVIVHEMTHAIVDGQRAYFLEQTNRDVAAFHEGFADLAALFRHFSHREVLLDTLQRTGGKLYNSQLRPDAALSVGATSIDVHGKTTEQISAEIAQRNPLIDLALQFGDAVGQQGALRSALGTDPSPEPYKTVTEPHLRGSILVAAVFDAFFMTYLRRTADVFAVYRAGGGRDNPIDLPAPMANILCNTAMKTANEFFALCVRAIDYCPPVDLTYGEFLRAMITAEVDRDPDDPEGIREALMQAFRLRGIFPDGARFFSEDALCWTRGSDLEMPIVKGLHFGDPNGLKRADKDRIAPVLRGYFDDPNVRDRLGFSRDIPTVISSFHPVYRPLADGRLCRDMVVEIVQTKPVAFDHDAASQYPFRAGATVLIGRSDVGHGEVRWVVSKPMLGSGKGANKEAAERHARQQAYLMHMGLTGNVGSSALNVNFALVHGGLRDE